MGNGPRYKRSAQPSIQLNLDEEQQSGDSTDRSWGTGGQATGGMHVEFPITLLDLGCLVYLVGGVLI